MVLAGCGDVAGPGLEGDRLLQTDALSYEWTVTRYGAQATIPYVFENRTGRTVYIPNCNGAFSAGLQRLVDGTWEQFWSPILPLCLSVPIGIPAGTAVQDTLHVSGAHVGSSVYPQLDTDDLPGVYRVVWYSAYVRLQYGADIHPEDGTELPLDSRVSNRFEMVTR